MQWTQVKSLMLNSSSSLDTGEELMPGRSMARVDEAIKVLPSSGKCSQSSSMNPSFGNAICCGGWPRDERE